MHCYQIVRSLRLEERCNKKDGKSRARRGVEDLDCPNRLTVLDVLHRDGDGGVNRANKDWLVTRPLFVTAELRVRL